MIAVRYRVLMLVVCTEGFTMKTTNEKKSATFGEPQLLLVDDDLPAEIKEQIAAIEASAMPSVTKKAVVDSLKGQSNGAKAYFLPSLKADVRDCVKIDLGNHQVSMQAANLRALASRAAFLLAACDAFDVMLKARNAKSK